MLFPHLTVTRRAVFLKRRAWRFVAADEYLPAILAEVPAYCQFRLRFDFSERREPSASPDLALFPAAPRQQPLPRRRGRGGEHHPPGQTPGPRRHTRRDGGIKHRAYVAVQLPGCTGD